MRNDKEDVLSVWCNFLKTMCTNKYGKSPLNVILQSISDESRWLEAYLLNVSQPFADILKAFSIGNVIDQQDAHGSSVVRGCNGVKTLLSCCIPEKRISEGENSHHERLR